MSRHLLPVGFCIALFAASANAGLIQVRTLQAPGNAVQLEYSQEHQLLFLRNSSSAIRVVDSLTGAELPIRFANNRFTDIDLSPSGDYLFAADYGGERTGYSSPAGRQYVHRYNLISQTWETGYTDVDTAWRLEAVDDERVLLQEGDQHVDMTLQHFAPVLTRLDSIRADYSGDFRFDSVYGRIYKGSSGSSSSEIHSYRLSGDDLIFQGDTGVYGTADQAGGGGTTVLSPDGTRFYYGRLQVEALDVTNNLRLFPDYVHFATNDLAFTDDGYYDARTGAYLGTLGFSTDVYAYDPNGHLIWAFNPVDDTLHAYAVPEMGTLSLVSAASLLGTAVFAVRSRRNREKSGDPRSHF